VSIISAALSFGGIVTVICSVVILSFVPQRLTDAVRMLLITLLVTGVFALLGSLAYSRRLTSPLRDLERNALAALMGSYEQVLSSLDRNDEIGRVARALDTVVRRLSLFQDLAQLLASTSSLEQVSDLSIATMGHLIERGSAAIYFLGEDDVLTPVRTCGEELLGAESVILSDNAWFASAMSSPEPLVFCGASEAVSAMIPGVTGEATYAHAMALAFAEGQVGLVVIVKNRSLPPTEAENEMLKAFCAQVAIAVQVSRVREAENDSRRVAELLRSVIETLVRSGSTIEQAEDAIKELLSATAVRVALVDRLVLGLSLSSSPNLDVAVLTIAHESMRGHGWADAKQRRAFVVRAGDSHAADQLAASFGATEMLLVPILPESDHGGVLAIGFLQPVSPVLVGIGESLGDEIALALDNMYLYQRAASRAHNLETVFQMSQTVSSSLQLNAVLHRVLDVTQEVFPVDAVMLMHYSSERQVLETTMGRGSLPAPFLSLALSPDEDFPGQVLERGVPVLLRDLAKVGSGGIARVAAQNGLRSLIAVPLHARGRPIGVLVAFSRLLAAFSDEDVSLLQTFAAQGALAIDTAGLYRHQHEIASVLQASIVPGKLPTIPGIEASSVYIPSGGASEVGGDYYDLFKSEDGHIWFVIADVCGKGVQAATKTSMVRYAVRALTTTGCSPAEVLGRTNDMAVQLGDSGDIVTTWIGRLAPGGTLVWASGGHPPGFLRRHKTGAIEPLGVTGPLLGAQMGSAYQDLEVVLEPGDMVLLYTDGVIEARDGESFYGEERVKTILQRSATVHDAATGLRRSIEMYAKKKLQDDVAILVVSPAMTQSGWAKDGG